MANWSSGRTLGDNARHCDTRLVALSTCGQRVIDLDDERTDMTTTFAVRGDYIQLDQLLKAANLVSSGGEAHAAVEAGLVKVDGRPESRKRAKLRVGQKVHFNGEDVLLVAEG